MARAENCTKECSNWEYCEDEGQTVRFAEGATCPDFHIEEEEEEEEGDESG